MKGGHAVTPTVPFASSSQARKSVLGKAPNRCTDERVWGTPGSWRDVLLTATPREWSLLRVSEAEIRRRCEVMGLWG